MISSIFENKNKNFAGSPGETSKTIKTFSLETHDLLIGARKPTIIDNAVMTDETMQPRPV